MAHFPAFRPLLNDMQRTGSDREHFTAIYASVMFDVIISTDITPNEILIGGRGINWACTMEISETLEISMQDKDFYALRDLLDLKGNGIERFGSFIFLYFISEHAPTHCSPFPVQPQIMQRYYSNRATEIDPADRTVFYRWKDQSKEGKQAHNFSKTEFYFGKRVADYCRKHNISSQWLTPEQAVTLHIQTVRYPWS